MILKKKFKHMKRIFFVLLLMPLFLFSQEYNTYKKHNIVHEMIQIKKYYVKFSCVISTIGFS